jgi:His/Glu/Gln/Arg/opine family amino acid ABC transporter permease subunit
MATAALRAPRERRHVLIGSLVVLALLPLFFRMRPEAFEAFTRASTWRFLAYGLALTLAVSAVALVLSLPAAVLLALARRDGPRWLRLPAIGLIEGVRAVPLLGLMFLIFLRFNAAAAAGRIDWLGVPAVAVTAALWLYTSAVNAETLRAALAALPQGQWEASRALGLSYGQAMRRVLLPQAVRVALPTLAAQFTTLVKDSSLGAAATGGFLELYRRGVILYQDPRNGNPLEMLYVVSLIYFVVNYSLGRLVDRLGEAT